MKPLIWLLLLALLFLHHDWWFWDDATLIFGWCPIGLFYQVALSAVASVFWFYVVKCHWPTDLETADASIDSGTNEGGAE
jgi:hypothetical protein